ncbi:PRC-barrel domain-containing protein [Citromicrobium bathyomarinum]|uniref:PRC-barrel domain-containing protein n=1 Tax=Citromicrobium bathyomarinum TaxID=72174 RepID=UPI00315AC116
MQFWKFAAIPLAALALTACESQAEQEADLAEDQMEAQAEQSAAEAGNEEAALGMTEAQLLDAELVDADGNELGEIEQVNRNAMGTVDGLVVELEGTDRYVVVPMRNLVAHSDGDDQDVRTTRTAKQLAALPDAKMPGATETADAM